MTYLFDILHPAHVHFFRNAMQTLREAGHNVVVTARDKDITVRLLELYGIKHTVISKEATGRVGLARELLTRNARLAQHIWKHKPRAVASIGGISTAQVGFVTRTPNFIFYDTENAHLSNMLSYPLATEVITPSCYHGRVFGRHVTYPGYHELAYLHPSRFTADATVLEAHGIKTEQPFSVIRFVSWRALHDVGAYGFSADARERLIAALAKRGKIYITSETPLPGGLEQYRISIPPHSVHHLLAFAQLFIGESATMASESVIMGTPAIYVDPVGRGYTDEQELRYQLCFNYRPAQHQEAINHATRVLDGSLKDTPEFKRRVAAMLSDKVDVTEVIVNKMLSV